MKALILFLVLASSAAFSQSRFSCVSIDDADDWKIRGIYGVDYSDNKINLFDNDSNELFKLISYAKSNSFYYEFFEYSSTSNSKHRIKIHKRLNSFTANYRDATSNSTASEIEFTCSLKDIDFKW